MVLPEKNLSSPPPQKKKKAVGLALSVRKNSGLARPKKKELAPFEIENRGASVIGQGQRTAAQILWELGTPMPADLPDRTVEARRWAGRALRRFGCAMQVHI